MREPTDNGESTTPVRVHIISITPRPIQRRWRPRAVQVRDALIALSFLVAAIVFDVMTR